MIDKSITRAYLIIPKLVRQPTWGGKYISGLKNLEHLVFLQKEKFGQSYELFGRSKILLKIVDSSDEGFVPEVGFADKPETDTTNFNLEPGTDYLNLDEFVATAPLQILGKKIFEKFRKMPLLIKITQSLGNSFQLHLKQNVRHEKWQPKAESWYYLEKGLLTFGLKRDIDVEEYKSTCLLIEGKMKGLSQKILNNEISLENAKEIAADFINRNNPHRFVNLHTSEKFSLIDLSRGGTHHSWEEDNLNFPLGNIVYEVQQDVMDPASTIRSFDQGKFKSDGSIRPINVEDYFRFIDQQPEHNDLKNAIFKPKNNCLLKTTNYSVDILEVKKNLTDSTDQSFIHLYLRDGRVEIQTETNSIILKKGFSCFLPQAVGEYHIKSSQPDSVIIKTHIEA